MTREEAIKMLEYIRYTGNGESEYKNDAQSIALDMAIKALEQSPILDKVIAEIMDTGAYEQEVNGNTEFLKGINYCLGVIDKYKAESEE